MTIRYICSNCNNGMTDVDLERWTICPKCGASIREDGMQFCSKDGKTENSISAADSLALLIKEHGPEIFDVSKLPMLYEALASWPNHLSEDRDRIMLLLIKNIPHILYEAFKEGPYKQEQAVESCKSMLVKTFSVEAYAAQKMVGLISNTLKLSR